MLTELFIDLTVGVAWSVLMLGIGMAVGRDRGREAQAARTVQQVARIRRQPMSDLGQLLVDGGSLAAARHEQRMRVVK